MNLVGGQDDLVFDGDSLLVDAAGKLIGRAKQFETDLIFFDIESKNKIEMVGEPRISKNDDHEQVWNALVLCLRDYVNKNGFKSVVLGLSGGIDSAIVATIAADAIGPENVRCVMLPSAFTSAHSLEDAADCANRLGARLDALPITGPQAAHLPVTDDNLVLRAARLMTVSVRPGRPNGAASGFLSGLFREPLAGQASNNPVALDSQVALSSPANTVAGIVAVMEASREAFGGRTAINLPALTVSVREMLLALEELAGPAAMALITHRPDEAVARIVSAWPARFQSQRTGRLGLKADADFASVLRQYVADNADAVTLPAARARLGLR